MAGAEKGDPLLFWGAGLHLFCGRSGPVAADRLPGDGKAADFSVLLCPHRYHVGQAGAADCSDRAELHFFQISDFCKEKEKLVNGRILV